MGAEQPKNMEAQCGTVHSSICVEQPAKIEVQYRAAHFDQCDCTKAFAITITTKGTLVTGLDHHGQAHNQKQYS